MSGIRTCLARAAASTMDDAKPEELEEPEGLMLHKETMLRRARWKGEDAGWREVRKGVGRGRGLKGKRRIGR